MLTLLKKIKSVVFNFASYQTPILETLTVINSLRAHVRFSFDDSNPGVEKAKLEYYLMKYCHIIEKGLALPEPRKAFGRSRIEDLIDKTTEYEKRYPNQSVARVVHDTLCEYINFHQECLELFPESFIDKLTLFLSGNKTQGNGGLDHIEKNKMATLGGVAYEEFVKCRHSVRDFSAEPVVDELIERAIEISRNTPSVCNRQGWFVHYYSGKEQIRKLLSYQNGNAGFTESIDKLIIVTASVEAFTRYEHNQLFVDGGLYSMNLILALHSLGLGSCPLNTCMPWFRENSLKEHAQIQAQERLIMMIAVGNLKDRFSVARSEKFPVNKILRRH